MKPIASQIRKPARRRVLLAGLAAAALPLHAQSGGLPVATALKEHLEQALGRGQPLVVMVSLHGCPFCRVAREHYLLPLWREQALPVVQVDMRSAQPMRDFAGASSTHDAQVGAWRIRMAPTVLFFGRGGAEVAKRLVGAGMPDFYGAYLEERLTTARNALG
jgi:hypothetical protein